MHCTETACIIHTKVNIFWIKENIYSLHILYSWINSHICLCRHELEVRVLVSVNTEFSVLFMSNGITIRVEIVGMQVLNSGVVRRVSQQGAKDSIIYLRYISTSTVLMAMAGAQIRMLHFPSFRAITSGWCH